MPSSTFEEPPQSEFAAKCNVELPIDDNAVKPSIGEEEWCGATEDDDPLIELLCLELCTLPASTVVELRWYKWLLL